MKKVSEEVKQFCKKHNLTIDQFYGKEKIDGSLDLGSLTSIPEGFNPTVGGDLDLNSLTSIPEVNKPVYPLTWNGHIFADGMLRRLVSKKGNIYKLQDLTREETFYMVSDGKGNFAHGGTIRKANEDLRFKLIAEKLKKEPIHADTIISVQYYRTITGACEMGCKDWMSRNGIKKEKMRADELLPLLEKSNAYGLESFRKLVTF